jgi:hypothetical protein
MSAARACAHDARSAANGARAFAMLVVMTVVGATVVTAHAQTASLQGNAIPTLDDPAGAVSVVAASAPFEDRVAFVVENGTNHPVRIRSVASGATSASGAAAVRVSTSDVVPARLAPGETAIGQVRWRAGTLAAGETVTWHVNAKRTAAAADPARLDAVAFVLSAPSVGRVAQTLTFDATNPHDAPRFGPIEARVLCMNEASRPVLLVSVDVKHGRLRSGASAPVTVPMRELCPSYVAAVAARIDR